jgi:hypothetical protein
VGFRGFEECLALLWTECLVSEGLSCAREPHGGAGEH